MSCETFSRSARREELCVWVSLLYEMREFTRHSIRTQRFVCRTILKFRIYYYFF